MKKSDLKTGMIVEARCGTRYMVICGDFKTKYYEEQSLIFITEKGFSRGSGYNEDLTSENNEDYDIVKIYLPCIGSLNVTLNNNLTEDTLIWNRVTDIDWSKVEVDTKVLVKSYEDQEWNKRHFAKYENGKVYTYCDGATSFSVSSKNDIITWKFAKLYKEEN